MSSSLQTIIALALVSLTALGFIWRWWRNRKKIGCGGDCGCTGKKMNLKR